MRLVFMAASLPLVLAFRLIDFPRESSRVHFRKITARAQAARLVRPEVNCGDYSFNLTRYSDATIFHYNPYSSVNPYAEYAANWDSFAGRAVEVTKNDTTTAPSVEDTTTAASVEDTPTAAPVEEETEPLLEDKISYNTLFFPFVQRFKAPNVVRCEENVSLPGCKELLAPEEEEFYGVETTVYDAPVGGYDAPIGGYDTPVAGYDAPAVPYGGYYEIDNNNGYEDQPSSSHGSSLNSAYNSAYSAYNRATHTTAQESDAAVKPGYAAPERPYGYSRSVSVPHFKSEHRDSTLQEKEDSLKDVYLELSNLVENHNLPGCHPIILPYQKIISSMWTHKTNTGSDLELNSLLALQKVYAEGDYHMFTLLLSAIKQVTKGMESSHIYPEPANVEPTEKQFDFSCLRALASYLGVSLGKDLSIAECEARDTLPDILKDFKEYLTTDLSDEEFQYDNLTVDTMFFNFFDDYTVSIGEYNLTLENFDMEYNITETAYAKIESLTQMTNSMAEYKDSMVTRLRSSYEETPEHRGNQGIAFDLYSPEMETINMLQKLSGPLATPHKPARGGGDGKQEVAGLGVGIDFQSIFDNLERVLGNTSIPLLELIEASKTTTTTTTPSPVEEQFDACQRINTTNAQSCWEKAVNTVFESVDKKTINSYLAISDLALISYTGSFLEVMSKTVMMGSSVGLATVQSMQDKLYKNKVQDLAISLGAPSSIGWNFFPTNWISCIYDLAIEEKLQFDMGDEVIPGGTSLTKVLVEPFGPREAFTLLPPRLINSTIAVLEQPEGLVQGLAGITAALVEKLSAVVEEGELAESIDQRSSGMKAWLLGIQVVEVLEGLTQLVKSSLHISWAIRTGNWPELIPLMEELVAELEGERFWGGLELAMGRVVGQRWELLELVMRWAVEPMVRGTVDYMEWLAEDVPGNLAKCADKIRAMDHYPMMRTCLFCNRELFCREGEDQSVLADVYGVLLQRLAAVEPSFSVLLPGSFCQLFSVCDQPASPLRVRLQQSGLSEAWHAIHRPLLDVKRALICHTAPPLDINYEFWKAVLL